MFIDKLKNGVHNWKKIKEKIDKHGQIVWVYQCQRCGVLGRQFSPSIRSETIVTLYNKCKDENETRID